MRSPFFEKKITFALFGKVPEVRMQRMLFSPTLVNGIEIIDNYRALLKTAVFRSFPWMYLTNCRCTPILIPIDIL